MKMLFIGDIYGEEGLNYFLENLDNLKQKYNPAVIVVNGENVANGRGINKEIYLKLMKSGVTAITMGNWTFSNRDLLNFIDDSKVIRPANYVEAPGDGYKLININGKKLLIINLLGRIFMNANFDNPFIVADKIINENKADYIFIDFHAEATSEKIALAHYLDGKVDAIVGTHTHVQTNDDRVFPKGTLYISDVGMTGPLDGVIGVDKDIVLTRFLTAFSKPNKVAKGNRQLNGVFMNFDKKEIEKISIKEGYKYE